MVFIAPVIPEEEYLLTGFEKWVMVPLFAIALFPEWLIKRNTRPLIRLESLRHPLDVD